ncbi:isoprenylcysteine carboxylmethyltransferase family protein [Mucilaginibacter sp. L196]|uniref:methyltransferase family protein n=1 Tax=Mucilaginibacter sp. L196 TaxID=1641870 RepID=UPI00131D9D62|nr:isoprenylcysteine carboxylmethyltransferase family protein [Mucilaginibacter sp. L196]
MSPYYYLQILFFASEVALLIFKRSKNSGEKNNKDRRSLLILWIVIFLCFTIGPYSSAYHIWVLGDYTIIEYIGMAICILGFAIRWAAVIQLGKMFTVDVTITDEHNLKTTGRYKIVRHPSYLGLIMIIAGFGLCTDSLLSFLIILIPSFWAINHRIKVEEQVLIAEFGEQYINYKKRVSKIIPGIF